MQYIITKNNPNLVLDYSKSILIKTHLINCETRRLAYFTFHAGRCKKQSDIIKLTLMAAATTLLIAMLIVSITEDAKVFKELIFPNIRTFEPSLLPAGKPHLNK